MSALTFDDVKVDDLDRLPQDESPEKDTDGHYCQEPGCTNEVFRNGTRGRWPRFCEDHKKGAASSRQSSTRSAPAQAKQAAQVLGSINDTIVLLMMGVSVVPQVPVELSSTASALAQKNDAFMAQAETALASDAALCRSILKAGKASGGLALAMAYAMLGAGLAPAIQDDLAAMRKMRDVGGDDAANV